VTQWVARYRRSVDELGLMNHLPSRTGFNCTIRKDWRVSSLTARMPMPLSCRPNCFLSFAAICGWRRDSDSTAHRSAGASQIQGSRNAADYLSAMHAFPSSHRPHAQDSISTNAMRSPERTRTRSLAVCAAAAQKARKQYMSARQIAGSALGTPQRPDWLSPQLSSRW